MANKTIALEDVRILFRNFSGIASQYNSAGNRNFCVILPFDLAKELEVEGWNIRYLKPLDPDDEPQPYTQVKVGFGKYPPKIVMITSRGQTTLNEETVGLLDTAEIVHVDLILNPYTWDVGGRRGVKAYVKAAYITIQEDEFEKKYAAMEASAVDAMTCNGAY